MTNVENHMKHVTTVERAVINNLREKLVGDCKGSLPEYRKVLASAMNYIIPRFEHTREVIIHNTSSRDHILTCSCELSDKMGYACWHMYAILRHHPKYTDASFRWHIGYANHYGMELNGVETELSQKMQAFKRQFSS